MCGINIHIAQMFTGAIANQDLQAAIVKLILMNANRHLAEMEGLVCKLLYVVYQHFDVQLVRNRIF